ncbi:MAG: hypothetical protein M3N47_14185 [Chloroflexota bacterium]|nr:hypothetical protein [Chloroflexota bacterium]
MSARRSWRVGSADDWIAVLCDIAPSLTTHHLLTYLELVAGADDRGRLQIELVRIGDRVIGERDHRRAARLLDDLKTLVLPDRDGPYRDLPSARLTSFLTVRTSSPARLDTDFLDALITGGSARVGMTRDGAGFGRHALPAGFPAGDHIAARHAAWARAQFDAADRRLLARRAQS